MFVGKAREWIPDLVEKTKKLKVGAGWEAETDIGPVISKHSKERILRLIKSAKSEGADVPLDGSECTVNGFEGGNYVGATVITGVKPKMECYRVRCLPVFCCALSYM